MNERIKFTAGKIKINKMLLAVFLAVSAYTVYDAAVFIIPRLVSMSAGKDMYSAGAQKTSASGEETARQKTEETHPLSYYMQEIEKRPLFKSLIVESAAVNRAQAAKLDEAAKDFVLKGIIAGDAPEAVIEDTKSGKTYFVKQGEKIGDVTVEEITQTRVKIRSDGQSVELVL